MRSFASHSEPKAAYAETGCPFCGDSPVDHFYAYSEGTIGVFFEKINRLPIFRTVSSFFFRIFNPILGRLVFSFLHSIGIAELTEDIETAPLLRSRVIWLEAKKRGFKMEQYLIYGRQSDFYRVQLGNRFIYFRSLPIPSKLEREDISWMDDKFLLKKKLKSKGISVPRSYTVSSKWQALRAFRKIKSLPVVVKPRTGSRGRHTVTFILDKEDLKRAFKVAQQINYYVQVEEQLFGSVCRATVIGGKLRGFLKANPPKVIGDGIHTVEELIEEKNRTKPDSIVDVIIKPELIEHIRRQGFTLQSVLPKDEVLALLFRTGRLFGGDTTEMCSSVHSTLRKELEYAAKILNVPVIGFDLIIEAPEEDPKEQKWGIIEGNTLPFIDLHDFAFSGGPANVAQYIWDLWEV